MYFVFILQHHLLKMYSLLLLVPRAMHLHPPAHPGIVSDALAERIAVEEPGMTATDQVSKKSSGKMFFIPLWLSHHGHTSGTAHYSTVFRAETIRQQSVFKLRSWAVSKGQIKELWGTCVCVRARQTAVLCRSWEAPLVRTPFSGRRVMSVAGYV